MQAFADQANPPPRRSQKWAFYNEIDPFAAQWIRNLMAAGLITDGEVDERSIEDVMPDDVRPFLRVHFFAGIAVWDYALNLAGWTKPNTWTGSCPCQPFSAAGKGAGFADERHLWPSFFHLIEQCRPSVVLGEQVASKDADTWIDLVQDDLEAMDYTFGAVPFPAAGVGAPHIRDRLYWMAYRDGKLHHGGGVEWAGRWPEPTDSSAIGILGNSTSERCGEARNDCGRSSQWLGDACKLGLVADANRQHDDVGGCGASNASRERQRQSHVFGGQNRLYRPGPTNGFWRDADWLGCRDGKFRPVEPGTFPLAHGIANRVGLLRGYGNAINSQAAKAFIEAARECIP